jgi:SAM-dependent methyltransferase
MYASSYQDELELSPFDIRKPMPGLRFNYHLQFNIIREHLGHGKLIDFGCGNGHFVYNAGLHGLHFDGVEFDDQVLANLKKSMPEKGFHKVDDFLSVPSACRFIRMSNVLEHFTDPKKQMNDVISKLELGGVILIEGPLEVNFSLVNWFKWNYQRLRKCLNAGYVTHDPPYHVFYSNYHNQRDFFISLGLEELKYITREDAWPFSDQFSEMKSLSALFKFVVAKFSKLICLLKPQSGNTFLFVGRKR